MRLILPALCFLILPLCTCDRAPATADAEVATEETAAPTIAATGTDSLPTYPSIPFERLKHIFDNATYLDATFYELPISINQSETAQIQTTIAGISTQPIALAPTCKATGHIWFQIDGKNIEEADIYFGDRCVGYVWYENGKPAYSNALTEQGAAFYMNIFKSVNDQVGQ